MTPLQNFKRCCVVGAQCCFTAPWCPTPTMRTVIIVQTKKVAFTHPFQAKNSWLDLPKSDEISEVRPGRFQISDDGDIDHVLTYDFGEHTSP